VVKRLKIKTNWVTLGKEIKEDPLFIAETVALTVEPHSYSSPQGGSERRDRGE
jgi:hypothetical protein